MANSEHDDKCDVEGDPGSLKLVDPSNKCEKRLYLLVGVVIFILAIAALGVVLFKYN